MSLSKYKEKPIGRSLLNPNHIRVKYYLIVLEWEGVTLIHVSVLPYQCFSPFLCFYIVPFVPKTTAEWFGSNATHIFLGNWAFTDTWVNVSPPLTPIWLELSVGVGVGVIVIVIVKRLHINTKQLYEHLWKSYFKANEGVVSINDKKKYLNLNFKCIIKNNKYALCICRKP